MWDVHEILAMRTSITGENELLVVWKPTWIPVSCVQMDGPVIRRFEQFPKLMFTAHQDDGMKVVLPVEPGTTLQTDCARIAAQLERRAAATTANGTRDRTPRMALNSVAKRKKTEKK